MANLASYLEQGSATKMWESGFQMDPSEWRTVVTPTNFGFINLSLPPWVSPKATQDLFLPSGIPAAYISPCDFMEIKS